LVDVSESGEDLEWIEPTVEKGRQRTNWKKIAEKLKEHPGRWARLPGDFSHSVPGFIRAGRMQAFRPPGTFEATMRGGTQDGERKRGRLYLRYVGEGVNLEWEAPPEGQ
jgi:hypothetical protein